MIVLRLEVPGHVADLRWAEPQAVLGSAPGAGILREDAGWAAREAVLIHEGESVLLVWVGDGRSLRLRPGESAKVGDATLTLAGIAPLATTADVGPARFELEPLPGERPVPPAPPPTRAELPSPRPAPAPAAAGSDGSAKPPGAVPAPAPDPAPGTTARERANARWHTARFDEDLLAALRRSPWFVLSAAVHGLAILLLALWGPRVLEHRRPDATYGVLVQGETPDDPLESGGPHEADPEKPPEELEATEVEPVPEPPRVDFPAPLPSPDRLPLPELVPDPEPESDAPPPLVGPAPDAARARTARRFAAPPVETPDPSGLDEEYALEMNRKAAARVRAELDRGGGALGRLLRGLRTQDILVVRGAFDHMEIVLEELRIPFTLTSPGELAQGHDFSPHKAVFWNCGQSALSPSQRERLAGAIREFVRGGGYLFTTDWALEDVVIPAFPRVLDTSRNRRTLPELVVDVEPAASRASHPLLAGVLDGEERLRWWLERSSHDVRVVDASRVTVLLEAPELATPRWGRGSAIAVTFEEGKGRVLHLVGHHYQQKSNLAGAVGAQMLPLNFLRQRLEAR